jgi:hypothetical protein
MHSYPQYRAVAVRSVVRQIEQPAMLICVPNGLPCEDKPGILRGISEGLGHREPRPPIVIEHIEEGNPLETQVSRLRYRMVVILSSPLMKTTCCILNI